MFIVHLLKGLLRKYFLRQDVFLGVLPIRPRTGPYVFEFYRLQTNQPVGTESQHVLLISQ